MKTRYRIEIKPQGIIETDDSILEKNLLRYFKINSSNCNIKRKKMCNLYNWLKGALALFLILVINSPLVAQLTEDFDEGLPTSYINETEFNLSSGTWVGTPNQVIRGTTGVTVGNYSLQLRSQTDASMTTPVLSTGVGVISFDVTASTTSGGLQVLVSETDDEEDFVQVSGSPISFGTSTETQSFTVNNQDVKRVRFRRTGATVYIDNVNITASPNIVFTETFGTPETTTDVGAYTGYDNDELTFSGNTDVRTSLSSDGDYPDASGGGNVFFGTAGGNDRNLTISGIDVEGLGSFTLIFGMNSGSNQGLSIEYSTDGIDFKTIDYTPSTNSGWNLEIIENIVLPPVSSLTLRFSKDDASQYRLDDVTLLSAGYGGQITEGAGDGFRFLASPVTTTYSSFLSDVWTQGATNSDHPESNEHNIFTFNGNDENGYDAFTGDMDVSSLSPGEALLVYVFAQDEFGVPTETWPKVLTVSGTAQTENFVADDFLINDEITDTHKFNLIGNPFVESITFGDFSNVTSEGLLTQVWVYDHSFTSGFDEDAGEGEVDPEESAGGGWRAYLWNDDTNPGSLTNGVIAPFQAFFMRNTGNEESRSLTLNTSMKQGDGATFYRNPNQGAVIQFASRINNSQISDTWLSFAQNATITASDLDMESLYPLDYHKFLSMYIEADGKAFDIKNLPTELGEVVHLPLHIYGWEPNGSSTNPGFVPMSGSVEMIWPKFENVPSEWTITLTDNESGEVINLRDVEGYEFEIDASKSNRFLEHKLAIRSADVSEKSTARFTLTIEPTPTSTPTNELPREVALQQNYPNPFNPVTQISYDLPESVDVTLEVFNVQGQRVATLVSGSQGAGTHQVSFDAGRLASGVYIYRLQAGNVVKTRKMMLIK